MTEHRAGSLSDSMSDEARLRVALEQISGMETIEVARAIARNALSGGTGPAQSGQGGSALSQPVPPKIPARAALDPDLLARALDAVLGHHDFADAILAEYERLRAKAGSA